MRTTPDCKCGPEGAFRCGQEVRRAVEEAIRASGLSAALVAERLSWLVGTEVTPRQTSRWGAVPGGQGESIPLEYVAALMVVLEDDSILRAALLSPLLDGGKPGRDRSQKDSVSRAGQSGVSKRPEAHLVRAWMVANKLSTNDVAQALGITVVAVRRWMVGSMTSAKVRQWFLDKGCPDCFVGSGRGYR